jgi:hypothetical protein
MQPCKARRRLLELVIAASSVALLVSAAAGQARPKPSPQLVEPTMVADARVISRSPDGAHSPANPDSRPEAKAPFRSIFKVGQWLDELYDRFFAKLAAATSVETLKPKPPVLRAPEVSHAAEASRDPAPSPPRAPSEAELAAEAERTSVEEARKSLADFVNSDASAPNTRPPSASEAELVSPVTREMVRDARRALADFERTHAARASIQSVRVLNALPRTPNEAELVHPGIGRYFPSSYWSNIADRLAATGAIVSTPSPASFGDAAHQLARTAEIAAPSELLVIVGHVDRDGKMRLADGSCISVADLSKNARAPILCLRCNTLDRIPAAKGPIGSYVGYNETVKMVARIASDVRADALAAANAQ